MNPKAFFHNSRKMFAGLLTAGAALVLNGCGGSGQDYGSFSRSLGGDIGSGYNTSLSSRYSGQNGQQAATVGRGTYPMIETSFQLASVPGDPFDYEKVSVQVQLRKANGGTVDVPAFFDGGTTWRMRYTPTAPGAYSVVSVKLNKETAHEEKLEKKEWTVNGDPQPGFVRIDRGDHTRFMFDSGQRYFPLGHNVAWGSGEPNDITGIFDKMHEAGENWSRVWMDHWDGKNLDWETSKAKKFGEIDLKAAKRWDSIVEGAAKDEIYFQLVLQHHGPYSSNVDSNWGENPYNAKNGGFLQSPNDFFIDKQARALTRRKLYYALARWGYSPNIMAFELFNEVENTDAGKNKQWQDIAMWHREMSLFIKQFDPYQHLITTSSNPAIPLSNPLWETVDYIQQHTYPSDVIATVGAPEPEAKKLNKPIFYGEFGPASLGDSSGTALHNGVWASLVSGKAGAAQYWDWNNIAKQDLYSEFKSPSAFLAASSLANHGDLNAAALTIETSAKGPLRFSPGGGFGSATQNEFVVGASGLPAGMEKYPSYLQGQAHRDMMPKPLTLQVSFTKPGSFSVSVVQVAKAGGRLKIGVDGKMTERDFPAAEKDYTPKEEQATLKVDVPTGAHTLTVENVGNDWIRPGSFTLSDYASALAGSARVGKDYAVAWIYNRNTIETPPGKESGSETITGKVSFPGLQAGRYRATWWDTHSAKSLESTEFAVAKGEQTTSLTLPPVQRDVALYITRADAEAAKVAKRGRKQSGSTEQNNTLSAPSSPPIAPPPSVSPLRP